MSAGRLAQLRPAAARDNFGRKMMPERLVKMPAEQAFMEFVLAGSWDPRWSEDQRQSLAQARAQQLVAELKREMLWDLRIDHRAKARAPAEWKAFADKFYGDYIRNWPGGPLTDGAHVVLRMYAENLAANLLSAAVDQSVCRRAIDDTYDVVDFKVVLEREFYLQLAAHLGVQPQVFDGTWSLTAPCPHHDFDDSGRTVSSG